MRRLPALIVLLPLALGSAARAQVAPIYSEDHALAARVRVAPELRAVPTLLSSTEDAARIPAAVAAAEKAFRLQYGSKWWVTYDARSGSVAAVAGQGIPWLPGKNALADVGLTDSTSVERYLVDRARSFVREQAAWLSVDERELVATPSAVSHPADYLYYVRLDWAPGGVLAEDSYVLFRLNHGNVVDFGAHGIGRSPGQAVAAFDAEGAAAILKGYAAFDEERDQIVMAPRLVFLRVTPDVTRRDLWNEWGGGYGYRLAYDLAFRRRSQVGTWRARIDGSTGEVMEFADDNRFGQIHGGIFPSSPATTAEVDRPFPYADYSTGTYADLGGAFPGGSGTCKLSGKYFKVVDADCGAISNSTASGDLDFGMSAGTDCTTPSPNPGGPGNTHAARSSYYHLTLINEKARTYLTGNSWLTTQVQDNVNALLFGFIGCNAYWDGSQVHFFRSAFFPQDCANTGEIAGVFLHEWGHGLDQNDGTGTSPDGATGESYGDTTAVLQTHDSCTGPGFFKGVNCTGYGDACLACDGVRDIDWDQHANHTPHTPSNFSASCPNGSGGTGPCGKEVHCESYPISEAMWDLAVRKLTAAPYNLDQDTAWQVVDRLWYLTRDTEGQAFVCPTPATANGCNNDNLYRTLLVADDCDGNLATGTPHMGAIAAAFSDHGIGCSTLPVLDDSCCPSIAAPSITATPGSGQVTVNWSAVANAASYNVLRNEFGCSSGFTIVGSTTGTSFVDSNVAGGVTYYYRVQGIGSNPSCVGALSNCAQATPTGGGCAITLSPATLPPGTVGTAYNQTISASGGVPPYTFAVTSGTLPPGLTLSSGGALTGNPTTAGTYSFTVTATDSASCTGSQNYALVIANPGTIIENIIVGEGLGQPNPNTVRVYTGTGAATPVNFPAYGAGFFGVNVAGGNVNGGAQGQIIAGPGPGAVFGPQVRGFLRDGTSMGKINFYAYGTLKYGANVATGNVDIDGYDEMLTGAGPGAVFGPHVRGFNFDNATVAAMGKVSFFAYGTLKYGVNVGSGDVEADGYVEILTGAGPSPAFGSTVRGFNVDNATATSIAKINFNAFASGTYGVNVAGGDVDTDGYSEIVAAPGPSSALPSRFQGYNFDGGSISALVGYSITLPVSTNYGGRVGQGDTNGDGSADLLAGAGRDPAADATVRLYGYNGSSLSLLTSFNPFSGKFYGVNPAGGDLGY